MCARVVQLCENHSHIVCFCASCKDGNKLYHIGAKTEELKDILFYLVINLPKIKQILIRFNIDSSLVRDIIEEFIIDN